MSRIVIKNSLNKADNGKLSATTSEIVLVDHPDYGLVYALVSNGGSNIVGLYDDLAVADKERIANTKIPLGVAPIDMVEKVDVHKACKKSLKHQFFGIQIVEKSLVRCTRVLYGNKASL